MNLHFSPVRFGGFLVLGMVLLLSSSTLVVAQQGRQAPQFEDMDADGDGFVSERELTDFRAERMAQRSAEGKPMKNAGNVPTFATLDTDQDGLLSPEEFEAMREARMAAHRGSGCGSGMGRGECQRGAGRKMASFEDIDLDGNGCISREELEAHHEARRKGGS